MGRQFIEDHWLETEACCNCGMLFAMPVNFKYQCRRDNTRWFYCPNGHKQHYTQSVEDRLRKKLERTEDELHQEREQAAKLSRSYSRVRKRIRNGVCPCCNRTFENLARHMATKHPDYGTNRQLRAVRQTYGLTQEQLAQEVGLPSAQYVSRYERGMELPRSKAERLERWLSAQTEVAS